MSCIEAQQDSVQIPLFVAGRDVSAPVEAQSATVRIERADVAFGTLFLCAGATAGDLCDAARFQWLDSAVVNAADPNPTRVGELRGVTGVVRSYMYDLGLSSQLTQRDPFVLDAARELEGFSVVLEGRADIEAREIPFRATIPIQQGDNAELGVPVVRSNVDDEFRRDVQADESGLVVRFDPAPWVQRAPLSQLVEDGSCSEGGPRVVCAQNMEQQCDRQGDVTSSQDCAAAGQVCLAGIGCADEALIAPDADEPLATIFRSLRNAIEAGARPAFEWGAPSP